CQENKPEAGQPCSAYDDSGVEVYILKGATIEPDTELPALAKKPTAELRETPYRYYYYRDNDDKINVAISPSAPVEYKLIARINMDGKKLACYLEHVWTLKDGKLR
ncbi:MAG TPA: hypothetical protein PLL10_08355, partial [Elusimicrobiales bacterium]|nr:hypothetical protein [Elusimicrobiales bacterium]